MLWASAVPRALSSLSFTTSCNSPLVFFAIVIICCFKSHSGPQRLSSRPSAKANKAPPSDYNPTCGPFTHLRGRQSSRWQKVAQSFRTTSLSASWTGRPACRPLISPAYVILSVFTRLSPHSAPLRTLLLFLHPTTEQRNQVRRARRRIRPGRLCTSAHDETDDLALALRASDAVLIIRVWNNLAHACH